MADALHAPIALFDSGMGGLTVLSALRSKLPYENLIYLGDTARLPYGTKSATVVQRYAHACARFLNKYRPKMLVIACNTATCFALKSLQQTLPIPVLGVIEPGVLAALQHTVYPHLGLLATESTVRSQAYVETLKRYAPNFTLEAVAAPMLVPLVESNLIDHPACELLVQDYLQALQSSANVFNTVILGCTHFPLLMPLLQRLAPEHMVFVNSAEATANSVAACLQQKHLQNPHHHKGKVSLMFTDWNPAYQQLTEQFLLSSVPMVTVIDIAMAA